MRYARRWLSVSGVLLALLTMTAEASLYARVQAARGSKFIPAPGASVIDRLGAVPRRVLTPEGQHNGQEDALLYQLAAKVPDEPTFVDRDALELMQAVAKTKRLDAARLLIKCLAFNHRPGNQNEIRSDDMMIPAIGLLRGYFGEMAAPLLYDEGVTTEKKWFCNRVALALRTILPDEKLEIFKEQATLDTAVTLGGSELHRALTSEHLDLQLNAPRDKSLKEVEQAIEAKQKRAARRKPH